ncbi:MAG: HAMP domain-containing histidine kinase [Peptococcaceae bacterium]|nr:HAMP domain-containing histidine kinase [Peptococcaceae bacterium]
MVLMICILLGMALAAALGGLFLLKRDVRQLGYTLKTIAQTDTRTQLTTNTFDPDITALAESINIMLERHQRDLLEKTHAEAALKSALTNISHDLRTPLTSALGYLQMLEDGNGQEESSEPLPPQKSCGSRGPEPSECCQEKQVRYLATVRERLEALSGQMNTLFEFARLIEGHTPFNVQKINICNVLRDTLSVTYSELESRGFTVDISIPDTPVICLADEDALGRVLQNLIKNVYVHGKERMSVRLDGSVIEIANKTDILSLSASGPGHLFERFYTSDVSRNSKNTGLGLAIAKELTERMGGRISAHVEAENDMLIMRVALPT